jgi:hypothetical protein
MAAFERDNVDTCDYRFVEGELLKAGLTVVLKTAMHRVYVRVPPAAAAAAGGS